MAPKSALLLLPFVFNLVHGQSRCVSPLFTEEPDIKDVVTNPSCPGDYGKLVQADDGGFFRLQCCTHQPSGISSVGSASNVASYNECLSLCLSDAYPLCDSVTYDIHKNCGMYQNGGFSTVPCGNTEHDWLYYIDPPPQPAPNDQTVLCSTECPTAHGQKYVSEFGELFHMECGKRHGTVSFREDTQPTYRDCIDSCATIPKCASVDYSNRTNTCYYGTHSGAPPVIAPGYYSAYSLGCAGACDKDDDGCCCGQKKCRGRGAGDSHDEL
ncbi:hypothetical protein ASPZODRAFT_170319 [Penicilliopsis zonata CBS 506.65]|uniref:Apple domain-containing protein n=1 Tax=Penicilliopsis zonata CBS 506.65 TaxID=1073090 RepID=A0A1L9S4X4_9EURO|nr:hypothetical protein ASPZODRAFT_170319 [Penicilliopsis zonata CBS 506.65]OJJ42205.1 hypothetical protein ASPZODRAFT_170319 [Penicilliopsis zonata CBS 506.65]